VFSLRLNIVLKLWNVYDKNPSKWRKCESASEIVSIQHT